MNLRPERFTSRLESAVWLAAYAGMLAVVPLLLLLPSPYAGAYLLIIVAPVFLWVILRVRKRELPAGTSLYQLLIGVEAQGISGWLLGPAGVASAVKRVSS